MRHKMGVLASGMILAFARLLYADAVRGDKEEAFAEVRKAGGIVVESISGRNNPAYRDRIDPEHHRMWLGPRPIPEDTIDFLNRDARAYTAEFSCDRLDEATGKYLGELMFLRVLNIRDQGRDRNSLKNLGDMRWLRVLRLGGRDFADECLAALAEMKELRRLDLGGTAIRGPGLSQLDGLPKLYELNLSRTDVDDEGLEHLGPSQVTRWVNVSGTRVNRGLRTHLWSRTLDLKIDGRTARVLDSATGQRVGLDIDLGVPLGPGRRDVTCAAISPDGKLVAIGSGYRDRRIAANLGKLQAWDVSTGKPTPEQYVVEPLGYVRWLAFGKDSRTILFQAEPWERSGP